jgi:hypothetical protein
MSEQVLSIEKQPAEKPFPWRCPKCRQLTVTRVSMPYSCQRTHDGRVVTVEVPNLTVPRCSNCGEVVFDYPADEQIGTAFRTQFGPVESAIKDDEVVDIVADSIEAAIRAHGANIAFQQALTAPEGIIRHFWAIELHQLLNQRWPGLFRVKLEKGNKNDILICRVPEGTNAPFVLEFKVPWSKDTCVFPKRKKGNKERKKGKEDRNYILYDLDKVSKEERGYVVTVFLKWLKIPDWAASNRRDSRRRRYTNEEMANEVLQRLPEMDANLRACVVRKSAPIKIKFFEDAQMDCTVTIWRSWRCEKAQFEADGGIQ